MFVITEINKKKHYNFHLNSDIIFHNIMSLLCFEQIDVVSIINMSKSYTEQCTNDMLNTVIAIL